MSITSTLSSFFRRPKIDDDPASGIKGDRDFDNARRNFVRVLDLAQGVAYHTEKKRSGVGNWRVKETWLR